MSPLSKRLLASGGLSLVILVAGVSLRSTQTGPVARSQAVSASPSQGSAGSTGATGATGAAGSTGATGSTGSTGATGAAGSNGTNGTNGTAGVNAFGSPNTRTTSLATAYQATDITKPAMVAINLTSTATISLTTGATNTATVVIGATNAVASGTGTTVCNYTNSNTGSLTIGLNLSTVSASTCTFALPTGWYWATRQTAGTVTITSAFDQSVG